MPILSIPVQTGNDDASILKHKSSEQYSADEYTLYTNNAELLVYTNISIGTYRHTYYSWGLLRFNTSIIPTNAKLKSVKLILQIANISVIKDISAGESVTCQCYFKDDMVWGSNVETHRHDLINCADAVSVSSPTGVVEFLLTELSGINRNGYTTFSIEASTSLKTGEAGRGEIDFYAFENTDGKIPPTLVIEYELPLVLKVDGNLKTYADGQVKVDGELKKVDSMWSKVDGVLKKL